MDPLFHGAKQRRISVLSLGTLPPCVSARWARGRAASELTDDLDVFRVAERTALQVVACAGRADALQTLNDLKGHAAVVQMFRTALEAGHV